MRGPLALTLKTTELLPPQLGLPGLPWKGPCDLPGLSLSSATSPIGASHSEMQLLKGVLNFPDSRPLLKPYASPLLCGQSPDWGIKGE